LRPTKAGRSLVLVSEAKPILVIVVVVLSLVGAYWGWKVIAEEGKLVPGATVFRTTFDYDHGMADTDGTFDLADGVKIYLGCWSPGRLMRNVYYKFVIYRPKRTGTKKEETLTIKAGSFTVAFDGEYGDMAPEQRTTFWPNNDMTRDQLKQVASAHQAEFDVGGEAPLTLSDDQLAEIRAFLDYTEHLPEYNPIPPGMR
jgi:hypothetical protein